MQAPDTHYSEDDQGSLRRNPRDSVSDPLGSK